MVTLAVFHLLLLEYNFYIGVYFRMKGPMMVHGAEAMKLDGGDDDHYNDMDVDMAPSLSCSATRVRFILKHVHDTMFLSLVFFCFAS
jgi:hypothetical protein